MSTNEADSIAEAEAALNAAIDQHHATLAAESRPVRPAPKPVPASVATAQAIAERRAAFEALRAAARVQVFTEHCAAVEAVAPDFIAAMLALKPLALKLADLETPMIPESYDDACRASPAFQTRARQVVGIGPRLLGLIAEAEQLKERQ